jgi:hypothetical protein
VRGRNSDNPLIHEKLDWAPSCTLREGLEITYSWIESQVRRNVGPYGRSAFSTKTLVLDTKDISLTKSASPGARLIPGIVARRKCSDRDGRLPSRVGYAIRVR